MKLPFGNAQDAHLSTDLLSGYLDNEIVPGERLRVEQHLHSCAACRAELTSLRQTVALLHALPRVPLPRAFTLSEVQVGVRRGAAARWTWGAARALGAVAALLVVAALAATLLQRANAPGATQVARAPQPAAVPAAPSAAQPTEAESATAETTAPPQDRSLQPPAAVPAPTRPAAQNLASPSARAAAPTQGQQAKAISPTGTSQMPSTTAKSSPTNTVRPTQPPAAAPLAAPSATATNSATPASALALAPEASAAPTEAERPMMLAAPATGPAAPGATGRGAGGGGGGGGAGGAPGGPVAPSGNPSTTMPLPAIASLQATLPANAGVVYTDHQSLTAVDRGGPRSLVEGPGISVPSISGDRAWVAYRVQHDSYAEIWAVRWDGSGAHLVASERDFPRRQGGPSGPVLIERMEWIPGGHTLGLTVAASGADGSSETRRELWAAKVDGGDPRYVLELGPTGHAVFSPDGKTAALLTRGGPGQPQGKLTLYNADGSGERTALEFPANVNGYSYESQLQWLPDGSGLWAGIPDAEALFPENASIALYRVPAKGSAELVKKINALDTFWSHDARQLAYTQPVGGSADNREIVLAGADGSRAQNYANVLSGTLADWSPDGKHFTYYSAEEWYEGGPGQKPVELGPASSMAEVHWVGPGQLLYLQDAGPNWLLVSRMADGKTAGLVPVPKDTDVDMTG